MPDRPNYWFLSFFYLLQGTAESGWTTRSYKNCWLLSQMSNSHWTEWTPPFHLLLLTHGQGICHSGHLLYYLFFLWPELQLDAKHNSAFLLTGSAVHSHIWVMWQLSPSWAHIQTLTVGCPARCPRMHSNYANVTDPELMRWWILLSTTLRWWSESHLSHHDLAHGHSVISLVFRSKGASGFPS